MPGAVTGGDKDEPLYACFDPAIELLRAIDAPCPRAIPGVPFCDSWGCDACAHRKAAQALQEVFSAVTVMLALGAPCRHITLTHPAKKTDIPAVLNRWKTLTRKLRRHERTGPWFRSIEVGSGRPHLHVIETASGLTSDEEFRALAVKSGFGEQMSIVPVTPGQKSVERLAYYVVKEAPTAAKWWGEYGGGRTVRPFATSQSWVGRLSEFRSQPVLWRLNVPPEGT